MKGEHRFSRQALRSALATTVAILVSALLAGPGLASAGAPFCQTLEGLYDGTIDVNPDSSTNEFVGHINSLEALLAVAPTQDVANDIQDIIDIFVPVRDADSTNGLIAFDQLTNPELAAMEGRIADWAADNCDFYVGDRSWAVDPPEPVAPICPAWPSAGSPLTNNRFPYLLDVSAANYFSTRLWHVPNVPAPPGFLFVPPTARVEFKGEYNYSRYFSFHPNDFATNNLAALRDEDLIPDSGSVNPWTDGWSEGESRRYTANLIHNFPPNVFPPTPPPNSSYVGVKARPLSPQDAFNPATFIILRTYGADAGALPPNSADVLLPEVNVYVVARDDIGQPIIGPDGRPVEVRIAHYAECDPYPDVYPPGHPLEGQEFEFPVDGTRFPSFPVADHRATERAGELGPGTNFGLDIDILSNADVFYMQSMYTKRRGKIFVARAKMPTTPDHEDLRDDGLPLNGRDDPDYQIRLMTLCSYNFWNGIGNDCKTDREIAIDEDGYYNVVLSEEKDRPKNSRLMKESATWMNSGRFLDGSLNYRILFEDDELAQAMQAVLDGGTPSPELKPYVPQFAHCPKGIFNAKGVEGCFEWNAKNFD